MIDLICARRPFGDRAYPASERRVLSKANDRGGDAP
jgi:hypothetical protein